MFSYRKDDYVKGQQVITCPKCGENKVKQTPVALIILLTGGCLVWIPVIGWIFGAGFILAGIILFFIPVLKAFQCMQCRHGWFVSKKKYKEYKEAIKQ